MNSFAEWPADTAQTDSLYVFPSAVARSGSANRFACVLPHSRSRLAEGLPGGYCNARRRIRTAFTLVEMIVATLLLAIGVAGALAAFSTATRASAMAEQINTAALLAQQRLTEIELQSDTLSGGAQQGDFGADYPGYRWQQNVEPTDYENLFKVTLTVQWGPGNAPQERVFTTFLRKETEQTSGTTGGTGTTGTGAAAGTGGNGG
ncbi:MAG TPA: prepilin-type N-terminal cleavage/methylation domain-containing protein [Chthonomonadaceae bacterium]|nr:prepilin-type N-terminal cleavage/methylation domain-containing protein [Chthonomonadaceae bacterium]